MPKFRKKPVVIEAVQWNGNNLNEMITLAKASGSEISIRNPDSIPSKRVLLIETSSHLIKVKFNDYVIRDSTGDLDMKHKIPFEMTYEVV